MLKNIFVCWLLLFSPLYAETNIMYRVTVPNRIIHVGEVRLVNDSNYIKVQTLIYSRYAKRAIAKIVKSERTNWSGNKDAEKYISVLKRVFASGKVVYNKNGKGTALFINFVSGTAECFVELGYVACLRNDNGTLTEVSVPEVKEKVVLSREYIEQDQKYILIDSFKKKEVITAINKMYKERDDIQE